MIKKKTASAILALCAVGTLAATIWWQAPAKASNVLTAAVARGDIERSVLATGTFKPVKLVAVGAQVSGRITRLAVRLGEEIKQGSLVAEIDSTTQKNNLKTADAALANVKAQLQETEADLDNAKITLTRQQNIYANRAGAKADLDSAEASVKKIQAQIAALEAQIVEAEVTVETAQANLGYTRITAPMDGTVLAVVNQEGQTVNAAQTAPTIVVLGELSTMTVRAEISEADVVHVAPGQPVYFSIIGEPALRHDAVLKSIEPAPESITSDSSISSSSSSSGSSSTSSSAIYYNGIFDVPNANGHFRTYMSAEVHIVLASRHDVLVVPAAAVTTDRKSGKSTIRLVGADGTTSPRTIEVGESDGVNVEVLSGLAEGEQVVIGEAVATKAATNAGGPPPPMGM
jgi:macrolide-specific efflux system membrane fusion protein